MTNADVPPRLEHLALPRTDIQRERRRRGGGPAPQRDYARHSVALRAQTEEVLQAFSTPHLPESIDPALIFRVELDADVSEDDWRQAGLALLAREPRKAVVLFSSDAEMGEFRRRLGEYQAGPPPGQKGPRYNDLFAKIAEAGIRPLTRLDRTGRLLRDITIQEEETYVVDLELWPLGNAEERQRRFAQMANYISSREGTVLDRVDNETMSIARIRAAGTLVTELLEMHLVSSVDLPPRPSWIVSDVVQTTLADLEPASSPPDGAPYICVIDSGITSAHPLLAPAVGDEAAFPATLGEPADEDGHGTMVAGIALYGDVLSAMQQRTFNPAAVVFSARVTNAQGVFDEEKLVLTQMTQAISHFSEAGCKVFIISLGDSRRPYDDGRISPWPSVLDRLARKFDVLLVVSAGNRPELPDDPPGSARSRYPIYLFDDEARIIDPATAAVALTVGSLAGDGTSRLSQQHPNDPAYQRIAEPGRPSPFTRCGPGQQGSIKPELCEFGGNVLYNGHDHKAKHNDEGLSVVTLNHQYLIRLFAFGAGTSFAAPKVANIAARLFRQFPHSSPNLIRALLALSASIPPETAQLMSDPKKQVRVCGYGRPDFEAAAFSSPSRVVLSAEDSIPLDAFHVYELPVPDVFSSTKGERSVSVALAYDPPVRHSRIDYLGTTMTFRLARGKTLEEVTDAYRRRAKDEEHPEKISGTKFDCDLKPGPNTRDKSTLQKAQVTFRQNPNEEYGDTYYLVIQASRIWAPSDIEEQRYAVAVMEEHLDESVDLYAEISQRVQAAARARARA